MWLKGCWPARYKPEEPLESNTAALDPNHTHFILVDDGTQHQYGSEICLRSKLEENVAKFLKTDGGKSSPFSLLLLNSYLKSSHCEVSRWCVLL